jgi:hypothetical protein
MVGFFFRYHDDSGGARPPSDHDAIRGGGHLSADSQSDEYVLCVKTFEAAVDRRGYIANELDSFAQARAEAVAKRLLSESMDRLAIVAKDISDLAAQTAIDLALIETKRVQIDRAQAENWALLRELTGKAQ